MNLDQVNKELESIDYQFRHTGNHNHRYSQEVSLVKRVLETIAKEKLTLKEAKTMSNLVLDSLTKI